MEVIYESNGFILPINGYEWGFWVGEPMQQDELFRDKYLGKTFFASYISQEKVVKLYDKLGKHIGTAVLRYEYTLSSATYGRIL